VRWILVISLWQIFRSVISKFLIIDQHLVQLQQKTWWSTFLDSRESVWFSDSAASHAVGWINRSLSKYAVFWLFTHWSM